MHSLRSLYLHWLSPSHKHKKSKQSLGRKHKFPILGWHQQTILVITAILFCPMTRPKSLAVCWIWSAKDCIKGKTGWTYQFYLTVHQHMRVGGPAAQSRQYSLLQSNYGIHNTMWYSCSPTCGGAELFSMSFLSSLFVFSRWRNLGCACHLHTPK